MRNSNPAARTGVGLGWPMWRAMVLASLGGALEFYDFILYGIFSLFIARAFFPAQDRLASLAFTFLVFGAGYLVRPLGGMVLGHFGDRFGRARVFVVSMLVMSLATLGMGLTPDYSVWGPASIVLVVMFRLIQGFCLGGELPAAVSYVVEIAPRRAGLVCGVVYACVNLGVALASVLSLGLHAVLPAGAIGAFGWRIGFILGGGLGLLGCWLRRHLEETPEFQRLQLSAARRPLSEVLNVHWRGVAIGAVLMAAPATFNSLLFTHMSAYLAGMLDYTPAKVAVAQNAAILTLSCGLVAAGWLGDHVPRHLVLRAGALLFILLSYPFYVAVERHGLDLTLLFVLAAIVASMTNGVFACMCADLFPTRVRFSGLALAINISFLVFGGAAPLTATGAIAATNRLAAPGLLMAACGLLSFAASFLAPRLDGHIGGIRPVAARRRHRKRRAGEPSATFDFGAANPGGG